MSVEQDPEIDPRVLVRWLGPQGARAGLEKSKQCTVEVLSRMADKLGISLPKSRTRQQIIGEIVKVANRRIDRPVEELVTMARNDLVTYFERIDVGREELLDLLKEIDATPSKEGRKALVEFAARELSETGRFMRIASGKSGNPSKEGKAEPDSK